MEAQRQEAWRTTELWRELESREGEPAAKLKHLIEGVLYEVEDVLDNGDTMPGNFTLHDSEHSRRVAAWMATLAGEELLGKLSSQDLEMLLLSAYLHDIGMTPPLGKVRAHYVLLLAGKSEQLSEDEVAELQAWLDDHWDGLVPPIADGDPDESDFRLADEITAAYVRHRHNDWSAQWIEENVAPAAKRMYPGWVKDLVRLCQSHHFGARVLKGEDFEPRSVDSPSQVLHLRYCACLLRVADVLDFDPERTPPILFRHRDVSEESAIFWHKDLAISFVKEGNHFSLDARPEKALIHHAIDETVAGVNAELALCHRLNEEKDFQHMARREEPLPHRWTLDPQVRDTVVPSEGAYEVIDGTFRPDARKLLDLLAGTGLYTTPMAAVRELLQNAFDAVREQIARERLAAADPADPKLGELIGAVKNVSVVLERTDSGVRLRCYDRGVGMSAQTITSRFLVGGTTAGHEIMLLERECAKYGFSIGRTAQFGIGVLSYFMIASSLVVRTRRSNEGSDSDDPGWVFSSPGLDGVGELRRDPECPVGTTVELHLRPEVIGDGAAFAEALSDYVAKTVKRTPCPFSFSAPGFEVPDFECGAGWTTRDGEVRGTLVEEGWLDGRPRRSLALEAEEGDLPDDLGTYRVFLGHFELEAGPCLAYMDLGAAGRDHYLVEPTGSDAMLGATATSESWNGMEIESEPEMILDKEMDEVSLALESQPPLPNAYMEIDWASNRAGQLHVHRDSFTPTAAALRAMLTVNERAQKLVDDFIARHSDSPTSLLNAQLAERSHMSIGMPPYWFYDENSWEGPGYFGPLDPPVIDGDKGDELGGSGRFDWRGKTVVVPSAIAIDDTEGSHGVLYWHSFFRPQYVGAVGAGEGIEPVVVWEEFEPIEVSDYRPRRRTAEFPPQWETLVGVGILRGQGKPTVWNRRHPLLQAVDNTSWEWAEETFRRGPRSSLDPLPHLKELRKEEGHIAAWILMCLEAGESYVWASIAGHSSRPLPAIWNRIEGLDELAEILFFAEDYGEAKKLSVVTASAWETYLGEDARPGLARLLGAPDDDWLLTPRAAA